jgi:hypothetical protein
LPTIAVGLITEVGQAEEILEADDADAVALARAVLYDARWPWHAAAELGGHVAAPRQYWRSQPRGLCPWPSALQELLDRRSLRLEGFHDLLLPRRPHPERGRQNGHHGTNTPSRVARRHA